MNHPLTSPRRDWQVENRPSPKTLILTLAPLTCTCPSPKIMRECGTYLSSDTSERLRSYRAEPMFSVTIGHWQPWWRHSMRSLWLLPFTWNISSLNKHSSSLSLSSCSLFRMLSNPGQLCYFTFHISLSLIIPICKVHNSLQWGVTYWGLLTLDANCGRCQLLTLQQVRACVQMQLAFFQTLLPLTDGKPR